MALKRIYSVGIVSLLIFLIIAGGIWFYLFGRLRFYRSQGAIENPYPYLSQIKFQTVADEPWNMGNFQPVIRDFISEDGANYIIGEYEDGIGNVYNAKIFVTGKIDEENFIESIYYKSEDSEGWRSFNALEQEIKPGSRIRVEYLSVIPAKDKRECDRYLIYCQMEKVVRGSLEKLKNYEENNIGDRNIVLGGLTIYSELYAE